MLTGAMVIGTTSNSLAASGAVNYASARRQANKERDRCKRGPELQNERRAAVIQQTDFTVAEGNQVDWYD